MALTVADLIAKLRLDLSGFSRGTQQVGQELRTLQTGLGGSVVSVGKLALGFAAAQVGIAGIQGAFGTLRDAIVGTNATLERASLQFRTLLGSTDAAEKQVRSLFKFAAETPFETAPIIEASRLLLTFGVSAEQTSATLKLVGDAAAISGRGIQDVAFWFGRAKSAIESGRPFGEAAQRLQEMGILTAAGRNELERLMETGASTTKVYQALTAEFARFEGAMKLQAGTFEGLTSTFTDNLQLALADGFRPFFDEIKRGLTRFAEFVQTDQFKAWLIDVGTIASGLIPVFRGIATVIGDVAGMALAVAKNLPVLSQAIEALRIIGTPGTGGAVVSKEALGVGAKAAAAAPAAVAAPAGGATQALTQLSRTIQENAEDLAAWRDALALGYVSAGQVADIVTTMIARVKAVGAPLREETAAVLALKRVLQDLSKETLQTAVATEDLTDSFAAIDGVLGQFASTGEQTQVAVEDLLDTMAAIGGAAAAASQTAEREFQKLADRLADIFEFALSDIISSAIAGDLDSVDDLLRGLGDQIRSAISDTIAKDLRGLFTGLTGGKATGGLSEVINSFIKTFKDATAEGQDVFSALFGAFRSLGQSSKQAAESIQAAAAAVGVAVGTQVGGGGGGAQTGAAVGTVVGGIAGGVVGSYFGPVGTVAGAALGGAAGGIVGGYIGGLFDPSSREEAAFRWRSKMRDATSAGFAEGLLAGAQGADVDTAFAEVKTSMTQLIQQGIIEAFVEAAIIKGAMGPLIDAMSDAMRRGLGPQAFLAAIGPGLDAFKANLETLRPLFGEIVDVLRLIGQMLGSTSPGDGSVNGSLMEMIVHLGDPTTTGTILGGLTMATTQLGLVNQGAQDVADTINSWPTDWTINVQTTGASPPFPVPPAPDTGAGQQHGGWVRGGRRGVDSVPRWLEPGEFVVRESQAQRHGELLEAINAGRVGAGAQTVTVASAGDPRVVVLLRQQNDLIRELIRDQKHRVARGGAQV